jgi:hypothetical protein
MSHKVGILNYVIANFQPMLLSVMELIEMLLDTTIKPIEDSIKFGVIFLFILDSHTCFGTGTHDQLIRTNMLL